MTTTPKPLVLIILDGFGHSESHHDNAVYSANKPVLDRLTATVPNGLAPHNQDGEVAQFAQWSAAQVQQALVQGQFTPEAALVWAGYAGWLD